MDSLKFINGSEIRVIPTDSKSIRSKRGQEQLQQIREYYKKNPCKFIEEITGVKLYSYQRVLMKIMLTMDDIKLKLLKRKK